MCQTLTFFFIQDITFNDKLKDYYYTGRHYQVFNVFNAQYPKLTPPAIRTNTDYVVLFNTDSMSNLQQFHEDFAAKMDYYAFVHLFRENVEMVKHGFMVIDNDPKISYDQKFFFGVAEEFGFDLEHIIGCMEMWKENNKQLENIANGKIASKIKRISKLSKPGENPFDQKAKKNVVFEDVADRQRPVWDTGDFDSRHRD